MFASFSSESRTPNADNQFHFFRLYAPAPGEIDREIRLDHFPFVLGWHPDCDWALFSRQVSRRHCQFFLRDESVWVEDLNSFNGTYLNDREIHQAQPVHDDDILLIHPYRYRCHLAQEAAGQLRLRLVPEGIESTPFPSNSVNDN
jgi:predicted component of type VI protein secretion system